MTPFIQKYLVTFSTGAIELVTVKSEDFNKGKEEAKEIAMCMQDGAIWDVSTYPVMGDHELGSETILSA